MPSPAETTIQDLAEAFRTRQEEIIEEWRLQAGELLRERKLDKAAITDHLPDVIAEITRDLELGRDGTLSAEHTRGSPPAHGVQRFYDGLDVGEVVAEYNLLRVAFISVAERHGHFVVGEGARIINHRIDEAVRLASMAFAGPAGPPSQRAGRRAPRLCRARSAHPAECHFAAHAGAPADPRPEYPRPERRNF